MYDVQRVREDFPALHREVHGKPLVYLDSAATSLKPEAVIDAIVAMYTTHSANIHRGVHTMSVEASALYDAARGKIARFVGAEERGVVFTKNGTEALNLVAHSLVRPRLGPGDVLLTTGMEHHANMVPWQLAAEASGFEVAYVGIDAEGRLDLDGFAEVVRTGRVKVLAVSAMSNVLGTINPVADLADAARRANPEVVVVVDGAQSVPHMPTSLAELNADLLAFSGHKMLGPSGVGVLAGRPEVLETMPPFLAGGDMILDVRLEGATFNDIPVRFEAGTPPIEQVVGLGAAVDYLTALGMDEVRAHEVEILEHALPALAEVEGVTVHGPSDPKLRGAAISFTVEGLHPHDIGTILDREGVAVRTGHHCAKPLIRAMGRASTTRASFYLYNTADEVTALCEAIRATQDFFR